MKTLHLIPSLNKGGAERICLDMCVELQKQGHTVKLVALHDNNLYPFLTEQLDYTVVKTKLQLSLYKPNKIDISQLQEIINQFQPDVIHSHLFEAEINLAFCTIPKTTKHIVHFHDNMKQLQAWKWKNWRNKQAITNFYERTLVLKKWNENTTLIAISKDTKDYIQHELPNYKVVQQWNAIDLNRFQPNSEPKQQNKLVMIGSFVPKKGQDLGISTIVALKSRGIECSLYLLGDGQLKNELVEQVQLNKLNENIHFEGLVNHPESYLKEAKIYIHTASYEPFGLVLIEAMACGLPVVCTDGKGNRELIQEGKNGFMVWERNAELLADKIQFLLENEEKRLEIGVKAHEFAQQFGMEEYVKKLVGIYNLVPQ